MGVVDRACRHCGLVRPVRESQIAVGKGQYCSMACRRADAQVEERHCERCCHTFTTRTSESRAGRGRFCSRRCSNIAWWATRPAGKHYRNAIRPGHPLADPAGRVAEHRAVLYDKIGAGVHPCHWCGSHVSWGRSNAQGVLIADHLDGDRRNNDPANLVPSCHACNCTRTRTNLVADDELYVTRSNGSRVRAVQRACPCGTAFLIPAIVARKPMTPNSGRYCSRSCARRAPRVRLA